MGSKNGHTVFDNIRNGWKRTVLDINGDGNLGLSIPQDFVDDHDIEVSDSIALVEEDGKLVADFSS